MRIALGTLVTAVISTAVTATPAEAARSDNPFGARPPAVEAGSVRTTFDPATGTAVWTQTTPLAVVRVDQIDLDPEGQTWTISQPSPTSALLVITNASAGLYGRLRATGQVAVSAVGGIHANHSGDLGASSLVLTSLSPTNPAAFAANGRLDLGRSTSSPATTVLLNEDSTTGVATGGLAAILASGGVQNEGEVTATGGQIALGSTARARLTLGVARPSVTLNATTSGAPGSGATVFNGGVLRAPGGRVLLHGDNPAAIYNQGRIRAPETLLQANAFVAQGVRVGELTVTCRLISGQLTGQVLVNGRVRTSQHTLTTPSGTLRFDRRWTSSSSGTRYLSIDALAGADHEPNFPSGLGSSQCAAGELTPGTPTISGSATTDSVLTAKPGTWAPASPSLKLAYQWRRAGSPIKGATATTYRITPADVGKQITVAVTGSRAQFVSETAVSAPVTAAKAKFRATPPPTITGTPKVGQALTARLPGWTPAATARTLQWRRNGIPIPGATGVTYRTTPADAGRSLTVAIVGSRPGYLPAQALSAAVVVRRATFAASPAPRISGTPKAGRALAATIAGWRPAPTAVTYQWLRNGAAIPGATKASYRVLPRDRGAHLRVRVTGSRPGYVPVTATSPRVIVVK